jgi:PAS domain S-box-containing protein
MADALSTEGSVQHPGERPGETEGADLYPPRPAEASSAEGAVPSNAGDRPEEERHRYRDLFDFAPDAYLVTDLQGTIQEANHAAAELLHVERRELAGKPLAAFVHSADCALLSEQISMLPQGADQPASLELRLLPRQRPPVEAALKVSATRTKGQPPRLRWIVRPVDEGKGAQGGREPPLAEMDEAGAAGEHARAGSSSEAKRAQAALYRQNEELMALARELDAFAHTVAHDLKQPLTVVLGFADMLNEEMGGAWTSRKERCCWASSRARAG